MVLETGLHLSACGFKHSSRLAGCLAAIAGHNRRQAGVVAWILQSCIRSALRHTIKPLDHLLWCLFEGCLAFLCSERHGQPTQLPPVGLACSQEALGARHRRNSDSLRFQLDRGTRGVLSEKNRRALCSSRQDQQLIAFDRLHTWQQGTSPHHVLGASSVDAPDYCSH